MTKLRSLTDEEEAEIQRQIAGDPENPEITDEQIAQRMTFQEALAKQRGRGPGKAQPKTIVTVRLDPDVVEAFKADGPGWQSRINAALRLAKKLPDRAA